MSVIRDGIGVMLHMVGVGRELNAKVDHFTPTRMQSLLKSII